MVERFNHTLKTMLRKHASKFGAQWDNYLPGVLWAYRNTPHESTGEKPSFLLFGMDCRSPTEAALLPPTPIQVTDVSNYREELVLSLSAARHSAAKCIQQAQKRYKKYYDWKATPRPYQVGDWKFPHEETGKQRKLSQPWHGPYRVLAHNEPDLTVTKYIFPKMDRFRFTNFGLLLVPQSFQPATTGLARKSKALDVQLNGLNSCCPHHLHSVRYVENSNQMNQKSPPASLNMISRMKKEKQTMRSLTMREPIMKQKVDHQIHQNHPQPNVWILLTSQSQSPTSLHMKSLGSSFN